MIFIDKNNPRAWSSLGYIYKENAQIDRAVAAYEKAFSLKPQDKGVCFDLGMAYCLKHEFAKAVPCFERIRNLGPDKGKPLAVNILNYHYNALDMLKVCYQKSGDIAKEEEIEREIKKYYSKTSEGAGRINLYE